MNPEDDCDEKQSLLVNEVHCGSQIRRPRFTPAVRVQRDIPASVQTKLPEPTETGSSSGAKFVQCRGVASGVVLGLIVVMAAGCLYALLHVLFQDDSSVTGVEFLRNVMKKL